MYPTMNDCPSYSSDSHMGPVPASGVPEPSPTQPYPVHHHAYISNSLPRAPPLPAPGQWTSGLCHCFDDPVNSCVSRGLLFGLLAFTGCACFYSCFYRSKLRGQYDLPEEPCTDCLVHFCCSACALCQEYRELKNRGFDMGIGWEANMDRQKRGVTVAPIVIPGMAR